MFGKKKERAAKNTASKGSSANKHTGRMESSSEVSNCSTRASASGSKSSSSNHAGSKKSK